MKGACHCFILHPDSDPIHKATIIPRGRALEWLCAFLKEIGISMSRVRLLADLKVAMGDA